MTCEKYGSGPIPDFSPSPTGNVFVKMNYQGEEFSVVISGDGKNADGIDNYQFQEITAAFKREVYDVTEVPAESAFLCYGRIWNDKRGKEWYVQAFF